MFSMLLRRCAALTAFTAALCANIAQAADASAWDGDAHSAVRLIAGTQPKPPALLRAGAEIRLAPGWKTYWRYPGDAGVPPRFDFARSTNVASVTIRWPAPHRFTDEGGSTIGYKGGVVFPLDVIPRDPASPITLRLSLDYAICEKLCVPGSASAELALGARPSSEDAVLAAADAQVPKHATIGQAGPLSIRAARREGAWPKPRIVVDVAAPAGKPVDLFAEGPTPDWALPLPEPQTGAPDGLRRFIFTVDGVPPGVPPEGKTVTLTAVSDGAAIEVPFRLD
jgi:DsbC/DsbD-like thiol-disulfide interchange protein